MGSEDTVSIKEAAELLGLSVHTIKYYMKIGALRTLTERNPKNGRIHHLLLRDDLLLLAESKLDGDNIHQLRHKVTALQVKVKQLEETTAKLQLILDDTTLPLSTDKDAMKKLYVKVLDTIRKGKCSTEEALEWSRKLNSVNEDYLNMVRTQLRKRLPWVAYLNLVKMLLTLDLDQNVKSMLQRTFRNLKQSIFMYVHQAMGEKYAKVIVPDESITGRMLKTVFPL